jgi:protein TonB
MSKKHPLRPYIPAIIGGAFLLLVISVIVHYISNKSENAPKKKERKMPPVHVELKPPPPPPPPPKVEKQPEPKAEKLKENKPEPKPDAQPKNNDAKPESVGSGKGGMQTDLGGGDVSRPAGQIGGNGNSTDEADKKRQAEFYGRQVARELENFFADDEELLSKEFRVTAKL